MGVTSSSRPKQNPGGGPSSVARLLGVAVSVKPPRPRVAPRKPAGSEVCGRGDCAGKHGENGGRCQLSALASANLDRSCPVVIDQPARAPSATTPGAPVAGLSASTPDCGRHGSRTITIRACTNPPAPFQQPSAPPEPVLVLVPSSRSRRLPARR